MSRHFFSRTLNTVAHASASWVLLIVVFLFAGITGHDPWKQDETYSFGIIYHFYTAHTWLVPINAGQPFMEKPPLYYWTAVILCRLFGGMMALHNAARLASFLYMLVAARFTWKFSQALGPVDDAGQRKRIGWMTLLLFLGMPGMARHAHDMFTDVALLAGVSVALYGLAVWVRVPERPKRAGFWFGLGFGVAFLSKGLFTPAMLVVVVSALLAVFPALRTRKTLESAFIAFLTALPFILIWPAWLYCEHYDLFLQWLWENNVGRFLGFSVHRLGANNEPFYVLKALLWFAFPLFPLACITLWRRRGQWQTPPYFLPVSLLGAKLLFLIISASARALYLIPLLPVLSVLGAQAFSAIPAEILRFWNNSARVLFSLAACAALLVWWLLIHPVSGEFLHPFYGLLGHWLPLDYVCTASQWPTLVMVIAVIAFWLISWRLNPGLPLTTARTGFAGIALLWCCHVLLVPWIDETRSYRPEIESLNRFLRQSPHRDDCIGGFYLGESIAPMLEYFGDRHEAAPYQNFESARCPLILTDAAMDEPEYKNADWEVIWRASRPLDTKRRELRLYAQRTISKSPD